MIPPRFFLCTRLDDIHQLRTAMLYNVYSVSVCVRVRYQSLRDVLGFRRITQGRRAQSRLVKCILAVCTTQTQYNI